MDVLVNKRGAVLKKKGFRTREAIMDAASDLVREQNTGSITVADIAQRVGIATSTLYVYFNDAEEVLLALVRRAEHELTDVVDVLDDFDPVQAQATALSLVMAFHHAWQRHGEVLLVRMVEAARHNPVYVREATKTSLPLLSRLQELIASAQARSGQSGLPDPFALGGVIYSAMENLAAANRSIPILPNQQNISYDKLLAALAHVTGELLAHGGARLDDASTLDRPACRPEVQRPDARYRGCD